MKVLEKFKDVKGLKLLIAVLLLSFGFFNLLKSYGYLNLKKDIMSIEVNKVPEASFLGMTERYEVTVKNIGEATWNKMWFIFRVPYKLGAEKYGFVFRNCEECPEVDGLECRCVWTGTCLEGYNEYPVEYVIKNGVCYADAGAFYSQDPKAKDKIKLISGNVKWVYNKDGYPELMTTQPIKPGQKVQFVFEVEKGLDFKLQAGADVGGTVALREVPLSKIPTVLETAFWGTILVFGLILLLL